MPGHGKVPSWFVGLSVAYLSGAFTGCTQQAALPNADSKAYRDFVSAFYVGLAGLQTGEDVRAKEKLNLASQLAPGEPSTWANLALLAVRQQEFDPAFGYAEKARTLAPENSRIEALLGSIESKRGKLPEAIADFRKAVDLDGKNWKALYSLGDETARLGTADADAESLRDFQRILSAQPDNLAVLLDVTRLAAKRGDAGHSEGRSDPVSGRFQRMARRGAPTCDRAAADCRWRKSTRGRRPGFLSTQRSARVPAYRNSLNAVKTPSAFVGDPFTQFLKLSTPSSQPAAADTSLQFNSEPLAAGDRNVDWAGALALDDSGESVMITADASGVQIEGGAHLDMPGRKPFGRNGVLGADLNYDFKTDLVIANAGGVRLYEQQNSAHFVDLTPASKLPSSIVNGSYTGAWAFDVDLDGDLDVILGSTANDPQVLRNNGDRTFAVVRPFLGVKGLVSFAAADIDGDGDPDVAMVDGDGGLHIFANERLGEFRPRPLPETIKGHFLAVAAGDVDADGLPDFITLRDDGSVFRLSDKDDGSGWDAAEIIKAGGPHLTGATANLILADFDNNGALDIVAGDARLFLSDGHGFSQIAIPTGFTLTSAVDLHKDGHLEIIGFGPKPVELVGRGSKNYRWQTLRVRAAKAHGDQRINSFGVGGEIEIRSGLLTQKQIITSPVLHFGLGDHQSTDVARIVWPNGSVQAEFELKANQSILAEQRLKGSCPFLFAWNGKQMSFVKDGEPWSPALGLHINAQSVAGFYQTEEWFKVPGPALAPHDRYYELRVTGELWETYYIDHYSLLTVDHPSDTEIFTDERFAVAPPALKIYTVSKLQPFAAACDDSGNDVSATVHAIDGKYLDNFGRGRYQGVTRDHWVELTLPDAAPRSGPLYLIGSGWMHPSDGTTNVALGQNSDPPPRGLSIEVPDASGKWVVAQSGLGFLAGRMKSAVLDISNVFRSGAPRKIRLRTNLEIYWDQLAWATGMTDARTVVQHSRLQKADLAYRGFSSINVADASSPEIPDYNRLEGTVQKWRDLEGYYTRYGDVRELLEKTDDRMVITNAGDEIRLRFAEIPAPPAGWKRDYVMIGDGWIKDGDYNSVFSKTVLPLPYHAMKDYTRPPSTLEDDPAYRAHPQDWQQYHTRYVTPEWFLKALWN